MEKEKIVAKFDNNLINHLFFNYLNFQELAEIKDRISNNSSCVVGFFSDNSILFCAILDFEVSDNVLHVREVAGVMDSPKMKVIEGYKILNYFCDGFAKFMKLEYVTFHGERKAHKKLYGSFGFNPLSENDYIKRIH